VDRLAWPTIGDGLLQMMVELGNLLLIGRLGTAALSGVGAAAQLMQVGIAALGAVSMGGMVLVAQAQGARDERGAGRFAMQALLVGALLGVLCGLPGGLLAEPLLRAIGTGAEVAAQGAVYLRIAALAFPALAVLNVAAAILRGFGDSRTPLTVNALANTIGLATAAGLVYGPPRLGVAGAALGAAGARALGALLLLALLRRSGRFRGARPRPDGATIRRVLGLGLPSMGEQLLLSLGLLAYGILTLGLGTAVFAAQRVTLTLIGFAWMPAFGYGAAATALVGRAIGAGDPARARALAREAARRAIGWMTVLAAVCFIFAEPLIGFFTADPAVREAGALGLRILCLGQPFWGLGQAYAGALRGAGDTRFPMWATAAGVWLVRMPLAWVCGYALGFGLPGIFISNGIDAGVRAALVSRRFAAGRWVGKGPRIGD
jgi:putative MATE family efflux protein